MGRIALIGSNGQLGSDIIRSWAASGLASAGDEIIPLTHADIDVTEPDWVRSVLSGVQPNVVINTSAFHRVDDCESLPLTALQVNALGVKFLAEACRDLNATLMHFSTDYVFDGAAKSPYQETDQPSPVSAYGISKLAGENFLRYILPESHILIRSSGLYGAGGASGKGGNFVEAMLRLQREGRQLRVVNDQVSAPTFTVDLAEAVLELIRLEARGTFHVTNAGQCSWHEFASSIFENLGLSTEIEPVSTAQYGSAAHRPAYSVLANDRLKALGMKPLRAWNEALREYLQLKGHLPAD